MEWLKQYDVLVYLEPTEGYSITNDGIRASNQNYQLVIRNDFRLLVDEITQKLGDNVHLVKAESSQVFDDNQCNDLIDGINRSLHEQNRSVHMV